MLMVGLALSAWRGFGGDDFGVRVNHFSGGCGGPSGYVGFPRIV